MQFQQIQPALQQFLQALLAKQSDSSLTAPPSPVISDDLTVTPKAVRIHTPRGSGSVAARHMQRLDLGVYDRRLSVKPNRRQSPRIIAAPENSASQVNVSDIIKEAIDLAMLSLIDLSQLSRLYRKILILIPIFQQTIMNRMDDYSTLVNYLYVISVCLVELLQGKDAKEHEAVNCVTIIYGLKVYSSHELKLLLAQLNMSYVRIRCDDEQDVAEHLPHKVVLRKEVAVDLSIHTINHILTNYSLERDIQAAVIQLKNIFNQYLATFKHQHSITMELSTISGNRLNNAVQILDVIARHSYVEDSRKQMSAVSLDLIRTQSFFVDGRDIVKAYDKAIPQLREINEMYGYAGNEGNVQRANELVVYADSKLQRVFENMLVYNFGGVGRKKQKFIWQALLSSHQQDMGLLISAFTSCFQRVCSESLRFHCRANPGRYYKVECNTQAQQVSYEVMLEQRYTTQDITINAFVCQFIFQYLPEQQEFMLIGLSLDDKWTEIFVEKDNFCEKIYFYEIVELMASEIVNNDELGAFTKERKQLTEQFIKRNNSHFNSNVFYSSFKYSLDNISIVEPTRLNFEALC
mgnify:CR=1 FL=1|tara:strand:- start:61524 stop:63254 length:1731 start_codon:yes stop_codon:yes gene_type:complete